MLGLLSVLNFHISCTSLSNPLAPTRRLTKFSYFSSLPPRHICRLKSIEKIAFLFKIGAGPTFTTERQVGRRLELVPALVTACAWLLPVEGRRACAPVIDGMPYDDCMHNLVAASRWGGPPSPPPRTPLLAFPSGGPSPPSRSPVLGQSRTRCSLRYQVVAPCCLPS